MDKLMEDINWLKSILCSIGDAVIAIDTSHRVRFMNPAAESLTGWNADDALYRPLSSLFKPIDDSTSREAAVSIDKAMNEGSTINLASQLLALENGRQIPVDINAAPIRAGSGEITGSVVVFRDLSERMLHERRLRENEKRYRTLVESMDQGYCVIEMLFDGDGRPADYRYIEVNQAFEEQTGLREVVGRRKREIDPEHEDHWFETYGQVAVSGRPARFVNEAKSLNRWLDVFAFRLGGPGSRQVALLFTDITRRRDAEQRLSQSEQRHRRLFESSRDGILILDGESLRIVDVNPFVRELLGYHPENLAGKQLWEIGLFRDKAESQVVMQKLKKEGYTRYENLPLKTRQGTVQEVEFICNRYDEEGRDFIQCNIRDISGRRQLEQRIQDQANALAESSRRKDEFLAMLSHELRNPLAPIFNALRLIEEEGYQNEIQREANSIIERQVRHLSRLVNDLLEVSRITTGRIHLRTGRVDLNAIVERAAKRMRPFIDHRKQELSVSLADEAVWLEADETRLEQIIGNLLHNASKYNTAGGCIYLSVEAGGGYARIRVVDNGLGIAPELLPHVFELFTQSDKSLDRSGGGLGVGLALAKRLVELHGGGIEAASEGLHCGSEFNVRLPLAAAKAQPGLAEGPADKIATAPLRILVVDDHKDATRMSMMLLRSWGHDVRMAYNGLDALQQAAEFTPQVVLLDIGLPDMDGYQVARHIRRNPRLRQARLVAVTGYGQDVNFRLSEESELDAHLVKPVEPARLKKLLGSFQPQAKHH